MQRNEDEQALRLLADAIATAIGENENRWVLILSHPAAVIARFLGDWPQVKHYYEQSLAFNPDSPAALSGLAEVAEEHGELALAREYAARCYKVLLEGDDFLKDARLENLAQKVARSRSVLAGPIISTAMPEDGNFYICNVNNQLASIFLDLELRKSVPGRRNPNLLWVWAALITAKVSCGVRNAMGERLAPAGRAFSAAMGITTADFEG